MCAVHARAYTRVHTCEWRVVLRVVMVVIRDAYVRAHVYLSTSTCVSYASISQSTSVSGSMLCTMWSVLSASQSLLQAPYVCVLCVMRECYWASKHEENQNVFQIEEIASPPALYALAILKGDMYYDGRIAN